MPADLPLARIGEICRKYGVSELAVFGSAVRDDFGPDSDIDVDIVPIRFLHWVIRDRVLAEAQVVYADAA